MISSHVMVLALLVGFAAAPLLACTRSAPVGKPPTKISSDLLAVHESYVAARDDKGGVRADRGLTRVGDGHVAIDATAVDDVRALEADLVRLGLRHAASFGRVVSGELPISAIPALDTLPSLAFARSSVGVKRPNVPAQPARP